MSDYLGRASRVKLMIIGVDGVLTDAGMYFNERGDLLRKFNRRDGMGVQLMKEAGIPVAIVSSIPSPAVEVWASHFGVDQVYLGVRDKLHTIENLAIRNGISMEEVAYISDDIDELDILSQVGLGITVGDGMEANKRASAYVTENWGGQGAVREAIEVILHSQNR